MARVVIGLGLHTPPTSVEVVDQRGESLPNDPPACKPSRKKDGGGTEWKKKLPMEPDKKGPEDPRRI